MATYRTDKVLRLEHFNRPNKTPVKSRKTHLNPFLLFGQCYCMNFPDRVFVNYRPDVISLNYMKLDDLDGWTIVYISTELLKLT